MTSTVPLTVRSPYLHTEATDPILRTHVNRREYDVSAHVNRREVLRERERVRQERLAQTAANLETPAPANTSPSAAPTDIQMATEMHRAYLSRP